MGPKRRGRLVLVFLFVCGYVEERAKEKGFVLPCPRLPFVEHALAPPPPQLRLMVPFGCHGFVEDKDVAFLKKLVFIEFSCALEHRRGHLR